MSSNLDKLRRLQNLRDQRVRSEPISASVPHAFRDGPHRALDHAEPGEILENADGAYYVVSNAYPVHAVRGAHTLETVFSQRPSVFASSYPTYALQSHHQFQSAAFIDTETTGLGSGAGVYCFMIGIGTFERSGPPGQPVGSEDSLYNFVVRQFFMRNPAEEAAVLFAVAELLASRELSITFNGRSFDLPLLRTRFRQNRHRLSIDYQDIPLLHEGAPHLDLLHPSRRLWKRRLGSCRLINLEEKILRIERSEQDIPGHMIPMLYTEYLRTGNATSMSRVFYHNREDIVSMVGLTTQLAQAFDLDAVASSMETMHPVDAISIAETLENSNAASDAEVVYRHALAAGLPTGERADLFARLGRLLKRQERWTEAAELWQLWITSIPGSNPEPFIELAKYCEWRTRDLEQAEMWTAWAIHNLEADRPVRHAQWLPDLRHRLQRIQGKRGSEP